MHDHDPQRRLILQCAGLAGAGLVFGLAGCGRGDQQTAGTGTTAAKTAEGAPAAGGCNDLTGLSAAQIQVRETFEYVETAADPGLACHLCEFYKEPAAGQVCGGCTLFAGPVHPDGGCNSFSEA